MVAIVKYGFNTAGRMGEFVGHEFADTAREFIQVLLKELGVGKSTFLLYFAALVATGLNLFGDHLVPGDKGKLLAVLCENDERLRWRRSQRTSTAFNWAWLHVSRGFSSSLIPQDVMGNLFAVPAAEQGAQ